MSPCTVLDRASQSDQAQCHSFHSVHDGDKKQLKQIYENFANTIEEEDFMVMYKYATAKPHGFLYIDTDPKEENMRFRSGFNEFIGGK